MNAFELRGAAVDFGAGRGLQAIDLCAPMDQAIALIGPSGAGKTTLLRLLAAAQSPTQGAVELLGVSTRGLWGGRFRALRRDIGLLYQSDNLVSGLRVFHNVAMGKLGRWSTWHALSTLAWPRAPDVEAVRRTLRDLELEDRLWDFPDSLSGGERQRVALARLILQGPRLWLADEPAAGLDLRLRRQVMSGILDAARRAQATVVVSLHDVELLTQAFDRVLAIRDGELRFDRCASEVDGAALAEVYEAVP